MCSALCSAFLHRILHRTYTAYCTAHCTYLIYKHLKPYKPLNIKDGRKGDDQPSIKEEGFLEKVFPENEEAEIVAKEKEIQSPPVPVAPS